jgi:diguanylate cyclase (GGDEF)-like protein
MLRVTVSIGVASLAESAATDKVGILKCADRRLYRAKAEGRDRTVDRD